MVLGIPILRNPIRMNVSITYWTNHSRTLHWTTGTSHQPSMTWAPLPSPRRWENGGSRCGCLCCGWTAVLLCSRVFFRKLWNQEVYFIQILWCVVGWNKKGQGWPRHLLIQNVKLVKVHQDSLKPKGERVSRNQLGLRKYLPFEAEMTAETEPKKSQLGSSPPCTRWDKTVWH